MSCYSSYDYLTAYYLGREIRRRNPDVILVVGGYHPSARPGDFLNLPDSELEEPSPFDHVVIGEGELPMTRIVAAAAQGERLPDSILGPELIDNLDDLAPLQWELLDRYRNVARSIGGQFNLPFSRGCPFHCSFCMERVKGESVWRAWSPARAEEELRRVGTWLDVKDWKLFIADAVFGLKPSWRREMLQRLARLNHGFAKIWTLTRIDLIDSGDVQRYHRAGFGIGLGLESGDPEILALTGKTHHPDAFHARFQNLAEEAASVGLPWGANIIVGHPGETAESLARSARFVSKLFLGPEEPTGFLSVDPYRFYPGSLIDRQREYFEQTLGTRIHRTRWWNYSEQSFTCQWVDPSAELDYQQCENATARLFEPIVQEIAKRFAYWGPAADYFRRSVLRACEDLRPARRLRTLADYHLWRRLTGQGKTRLVDEAAARRLFRESRRETVTQICSEYRSQIPHRISAAVIEEPRECYVPEESVLKSTEDVPISLLPDSQATISALHAYLLNYTLLDLREGDRLIEVGTGTGYGARVAARIVGGAGLVVTCEIHPELAATAAHNLRDRQNVRVVCGDGTALEVLPPFNKALFTCAIPDIPQTFLDALPEGGRLVAPLSAEQSSQRLTLVVRTDGKLHVSRHGPVQYVAAVHGTESRIVVADS
jgi:protein-L-isoaspartate(D-aspartate) O-methyltransferase